MTEEEKNRISHVENQQSVETQLVGDYATIHIYHSTVAVSRLAEVSLPSVISIVLARESSLLTGHIKKVCLA